MTKYQEEFFDQTDMLVCELIKKENKILTV
jgi:hypothetical protein